jgi:IMP dehydrogenase
MFFFLAEMLTPSEANDILCDSKKVKIPIVNLQGRLVSLSASSCSDLLKNQAYPLASKRPESKQLFRQIRLGI